MLLTVGLGIIGGVAAVGPIAQDPLYFLFADQRPMLGIANFMNVMSNLPFLIIGLLGIRIIAENLETVTASTGLAWNIFFAGIALTAFGSGYFHLSPSNDSLLWDRLPMTIGFMCLVSIIISEYFSAVLGRRLLLPLLLIGVGSVAYWAHTQSNGVGDLRPYAVVQFLPMLLIPMTIILHGNRSDLGRFVWWMLGFYIAAKLAELFDAQLYAFGHVISGHTLKHVLAALAPASLACALLRRRGRDTPVDR